MLRPTLAAPDSARRVGPVQPLDTLVAAEARESSQRGHAMDVEISLPDPAREHALTRVFVISSIRFYCEGLAQLLERRIGIRVAGAERPSESGIARACAAAPEVVLVDISTDEGLAALRELAVRVPASRLVALAVSDSDREVLACAEAGVAGYVTREDSCDALVAILLSSARGELHCPALVADILRRRLVALARSQLHDDCARSSLTSREVEILRHLGRGLSNKEIAQRLHIEVSTVKSHVHSILEKLRVRRRSEAVARIRGQIGGLQFEFPMPER